MWKSVALMYAAMSIACGFTNPPGPLASAARAGDLDQIAVLVKAGADVNAPSGVNGWTPAVHAIHKGQLGALRRLADLGASLDGEVGREALVMASGYGDEPTVRFLLDRGVPARVDGDDGDKVLVAAVQGSWDIDYHWRGCAPHTDVVRTLRAHDPTLRLGTSGEGKAARAWARDKGCDEMLRLIGE